MTEQDITRRAFVRRSGATVGPALAAGLLPLSTARAEAKASRDFATADRIRDELKDDGIILEDGPSGTTWRRT